MMNTKSHCNEFQRVVESELDSYKEHGRRRLLLPLNVVDQIEADALAKELRETEAQQLSNQSAAEAEEQSSVEKPMSAHDLKKAMDANPFFGLEPDKFPQTDPEQVLTFHFEELCNQGAGIKAKYVDRYDIDRLKGLGQLLRERGPYRKLARIPDNWAERLVALATDMPNFMDTVQLLRAEFQLAETSGERVLKLPPILLLGEPGVGKSMFAEALAHAIGTSYRRIQMETTAHGSTLAGSSEHWGNSKWGSVFDLLLMGEYANPVILLDELEKAPTPREHSSPYSALYSLWEADSAARFTDMSVPAVKADASRIIWLATANDLSGVPAPIASRMLVVHVRGMNRKDSLRLVQKLFVHAGLQVSHKVNFEPLAEALAEKLATQSPRVIKRLLRLAIGLALFDGRNALTAGDIAQATGIVRSEDAAAGEAVQVRS